MRGFSYIEIIITVAILALLATAAVPYLELTTTRQKEADLNRNLREIREAIDRYKRASDEGHIPRLLEDSGYPKRLEDLSDGIEDAQDPKKNKIYFLRRIPRDPMYPTESESAENAPAAKTWGKRSYDSPPDQPQAGKDVFDVYSLSEQKGLNGILYNQW
ncbi:MAG: type II secretion system protein [Methylophilaceae bacterium]|nr:type II secretion system protein [Methylophilaceae bacterium]